MITVAAPCPDRVTRVPVTAPALRKRPRLRAQHLQTMGVVPRASAVSDARRAVKQILARWGVAGEPLCRAELFAGELLANALHHAAPADGEEIGLLLAEGGGAVLIEVEDGGGADTPAARGRGGEDGSCERGRGLALVEELGWWGWRTWPDGHRTTWAYLPARGEGWWRSPLRPKATPS
ncbi:ATP-binding protein [Streptomyces sp. NPDC051162]|uniref:ATP-binding protein n=1 Tax=Streptomyces sp. NPDC051162 TaxID=3154747 RepID=UPI003444B194